VRFHAKPPVNGRELTADDARYTFEHIVTEKGSANVSMFRAIAKIEALDRYSVKFTLKEPFAWFLDMIANPMAGAIIARECVEKFGDLKKPEAVIGTGPWMLETYRPNVSLTLVRNPAYFVSGLPYIDRVEMFVDEDNASRLAAFLGGKYDLGWEFPGTINRSDWVQLVEPLKKRRPDLKTAEFPSNVVNLIDMRTDKPPFSDVRVRQAVSLAIDRKGMIDATLEGIGAVNGPLPAALSDWALPIAELGEGAKYYRHDPAEAKRLLAAAGHPNGLPASICFATYGSTMLVDTMQLLLKDLKAVGIGAVLDQKEYGAYQATCRLGKFDSMVFGPLTPFLEPDSFLFGQYYTGEPRNRSHVNDPALDDLLVRQRRTADPKGRREVINQIERHLAKQQYYVAAPSGTYVSVWDAALKNYGPNLGYDYGGRLVAPGSIGRAWGHQAWPVLPVVATSGFSLELEQEQEQHAGERQSQHPNGILPMGRLSRGPGQFVPFIPALLDVVRDALRDPSFFFGMEVARRRLRLPDLADEGGRTKRLGIDAGNDLAVHGSDCTREELLGKAEATRGLPPAPGLSVRGGRGGLSAGSPASCGRDCGTILRPPRVRTEHPSESSEARLPCTRSSASAGRAGRGAPET
jgi:peptide/nickel transport system substrate-binding protein